MRAAWLLLLLAVCRPVWAAQGDDDAAALALGATTSAPDLTPHSTALVIEGAATAAAQSRAGELGIERLSVDARYDGSLASGLRGILAERLDSEWTEAPDGSREIGGNQEIGTLKEAYLSWQAAANSLVDVGRINARQGVAFGYNPTDVFRADAIRSLVSPDPDSLRNNRLGTVMLRGEQLWTTGALTAVYAPRLTDRTSSAALDPDWGATNSGARWLLSVSQRLAPGWTPQWLAFGGAGLPPQVGMDLTASLGSSMIAYLEASGGSSRSLLAQSLDRPQEDQRHTRASTGVTYTLSNKLSVTLEYEYNGAGLTAGGWSRLRAGAPVDYGRYRGYALAQQDLPTQSNGFVYASWQDVMFRHLDLNAFLRLDLADHSTLPWCELRRHWNAVDLALRWQDARGNPTSDYGASTGRQTWQLVLDYYW